MSSNLYSHHPISIKGYSHVKKEMFAAVQQSVWLADNRDGRSTLVTQSWAITTPSFIIKNGGMFKCLCFTGECYI